MESPSRFARLRRAVFARHANPCSAWTRWASAPLVLLPVWTRRWSHAAAVGVWFALNPVLFPRPANNQAWSTRAMLGEEMWVLERPRGGALAVNLAATAAGAGAGIAAHRRSMVAAGGAMAVQMGLILAYWELMVRRFDGRQHTGD